MSAVRIAELEKWNRRERVNNNIPSVSNNEITYGNLPRNV